MDRTITLPAGATFQYPIFDMLFRRNEYELKIPGKFILALAFLGGAIVLRKIASLGQSLVRGIVSRERVALTRNDGHENFEDRYAIITGADGLMGRAYAKELAARSFNLIIIGHDAEKLEDLTRDIMTHIGVNVKPVVTDIKDTTDMDVFRTKLETYCEFINVQVVVNAENRRLQNDGPAFHDTDFAVLKEQIACHTLIPLITTQVGIQNMKEWNKTGGQVGIIINASTGIVSVPNSNLALYGGSRMFADYFSQSLGNAYRKDGIYVASLRQFQWPGTTEEGFQTMAKNSLKEVTHSALIYGSFINRTKNAVWAGFLHKIVG